MRSLRRLKLLLPVALLLALTAACRVDTDVRVRVDEDGSGQVEVAVGLDEDALAHLPDLDGEEGDELEDLARLVRTADLEAAGWRAGDPEMVGDTAWLRIRKPFGTPEEAAAILGELTGPDGVLSGLRLERTTSFAVDRFTFSGVADLAGGLEAFGDAELAEVLDGQPLGEDMAAMEDRYGQPVADMYHLDLRVELPGGVQRSWQPELGGSPVEMSLASTSYNVPAIVLAAVAAACFLALVPLAVVAVLRRTGSREL